LTRPFKSPNLFSGAVMQDRLARLAGKDVEVKAGGIIYRGRYVGADETYVYLQGKTTWLTINMDAVSGVKLADAPDSQWEFKRIEGARDLTDEEREKKRRYRRSDFLSLVTPEKEDSDWPRDE